MAVYDCNFMIGVVDAGANWTITGYLGGVVLKSGSVAKATYPTEEAARRFAESYLANAFKTSLGW